MVTSSVWFSIAWPTQRKNKESFDSLEVLQQMKLASFGIHGGYPSSPVWIHSHFFPRLLCPVLFCRDTKTKLTSIYLRTDYGVDSCSIGMHRRKRENSSQFGPLFSKPNRQQSTGFALYSPHIILNRNVPSILTEPSLFSQSCTL